MNVSCGKYDIFLGSKCDIVYKESVTLSYTESVILTMYTESVKLSV
jgi:hypothetical protein